MATATPIDSYGRAIVGKWEAGVGIGVAGVIPMIVFSSVLMGKELFPLFGLLPFAMLWGILYVGLATFDHVNPLAANPLTGVPLGVVYGFLVWWGPQVGKPVGEYVSVNGVVQVVLFGAIVGLLYAYSPEADR
jgi:hypothetical protein